MKFTILRKHLSIIDDLAKAKEMGLSSVDFCANISTGSSENIIEQLDFFKKNNS
jgi:hypothetical protein